MSTLFDVFPAELKEKIIEQRIAERKFKSKKQLKPDTTLKNYAFQRIKKLPLENQRNVLSALTHFFNVKGVTLEDRQEAYKKVILKAEQYEICTMGFIEQFEQYLENCSRELKN